MTFGLSLLPSVPILSFPSFGFRPFPSFSEKSKRRGDEKGENKHVKLTKMEFRKRKSNPTC